MTLVVCAGGTVTIENPQNSLLGHQPRWVWFVKLLASVSIPVPGLSSFLCLVKFMFERMAHES